MPVTEADVRRFLTIATGPGGANPQPTASDSFGGFASHTAYVGSVIGDLYDAVPETPAVGYAEYRCLFVANASLADTWYAVKAYLEAIPGGGADILIGVDPIGVVSSTSSSPQAARPANATTAPSGVSFSTPRDYASGVVIGTLAPGQGRALWLRRSVSATPAITSVLTASLALSGYPTG